MTTTSRAPLRSSREHARRSLPESGVAADRFRIEVNAAFDRLEDEAVNEYLDWYYSLPAEYGRIGMMLQGRLEQYLAEKVRETFQQSAWYHDVEAAFDAVLIEQENARAAYERAVGEIIDENLVTPDQAAFDVALTASLNDIVQPAFHHDTIPVARRLATAGAGSAVAGGVTFVIVQKITAKVVGKQVLKLAAKAPLKALAGKLAGAGRGRGNRRISRAGRRHRGRRDRRRVRRHGPRRHG